MEPVLALRPFVPAKDFTRSRLFYEALGFQTTHENDSIAILKMGSFSFILQNHHVRESAENCMVQLLVRDVAAWWARHDPAALVPRFDVKAPKAPAVQSWGLTVGFVFDPSGVLWHIAEAPF